MGSDRGASVHRLIEVPLARLPRWLGGFADRHGVTDTEWVGQGLRLHAADGAAAELESPFPKISGEDNPYEPVEPDERITASSTHLTTRFAVRALLADEAVVVLIRRGGYAIGRTHHGQVVATKAGTRYVQGKTAAGGWSQQRYARRRAGQTADLVATAVSAVREIRARSRDLPSAAAVVVGGDAALVNAVLQGAGLADLPRSVLFDVHDPRSATVPKTLARARSVRIRLNQLA